jgi:hypothetical protein
LSKDEIREPRPRKLRVVPRLKKMGEVNGLEFYKLTRVDRVKDEGKEKEDP